MKWEDVNKVIKWTLQNAKHLDISDVYLIEKATDNCHLALSQNAVLTSTIRFGFEGQHCAEVLEE